MGIIQNQASKSTVYIYIGVAIGFANTLLFPRFLEASDKGLIDAMTSLALIMASIFSFGIPLATLRLFPKFRNEENKHEGYFGFLLLLSLIGFLVGWVAMYIYFKVKIPESSQTVFYFTLLLAAFLFRLLFNNVDVYNRMLYNSVLGSLSSNLILKLISLISILLFSFSFINLNTLLLFHVIALSSPGVLSILYVIFFQQKSFRFSSAIAKMKQDNIRKEFFLTSFYGVMGAVGGVVMLEIDRLMLLDYMGKEQVGIYATAAFFGIMVNIPSRALRGIASVVISDSWKNNNIENIKDVYQKSTLNLQLISGYFLIGILLCSKHLYSFMKPEYAQGIDIIVFIAIAQFVDALTSVNTDILSTSKYYKWQTGFMFLMIVLVVGLNMWLIPLQGMKGAAISTMVSLSLVNIFRTLFIQFKIQLQPFTSKNIIGLLLLVIVYVLCYYFDSSFDLIPIFKLTIVALVITVLYWLPVYFMKLSPELLTMISSKIRKIKK